MMLPNDPHNLHPFLKGRVQLQCISQPLTHHLSVLLLHWNMSLHLPPIHVPEKYLPILIETQLVIQRAQCVCIPFRVLQPIFPGTFLVGIVLWIVIFWRFGQKGTMCCNTQFSSALHNVTLPNDVVHSNLRTRNTLHGA